MMHEECDIQNEVRIRLVRLWHCMFNNTLQILCY